MPFCLQEGRTPPPSPPFPHHMGRRLQIEKFTNLQSSKGGTGVETGEGVVGAAVDAGVEAVVDTGVGAGVDTEVEAGVDTGVEAVIQPGVVAVVGIL